MQELEIQQVGRVEEVFNKYFQCIAIWKRETGIIDENVTRTSLGCDGKSIEIVFQNRNNLLRISKTCIDANKLKGFLYEIHILTLHFRSV